MAIFLTNLVVLWFGGCGFFQPLDQRIMIRSSNTTTIEDFCSKIRTKFFGACPILHESRIISTSSVQVLLVLTWDFCMICRMLCGLYQTVADHATGL